MEKILDGQFVDMAELLPDNIELLRREAAVPRSSSDSKVRLRQIASITAWAQCFATFVAIRAQAAPATVLALLAYMRLLIREAARHPGLGWLSYDSFFRQQAAADLSLRWDSLHSDLFAITVADAAVSSGRARPLCRLCLEPDHAALDCALAQGLVAFAASNTVGSRQETEGIRLRKRGSSVPLVQFDAAGLQGERLSLPTRVLYLRRAAQAT